MSSQYSLSWMRLASVYWGAYAPERMNYLIPKYDNFGKRALLILLLGLRQVRKGVLLQLLYLNAPIYLGNYCKIAALHSFMGGVL